MSQSYGVKEAREPREPRKRINLCGDCGKPVSETELLCTECRQNVYTVDSGVRPC